MDSQPTTVVDISKDACDLRIARPRYGHGGWGFGNPFHLKGKRRIQVTYGYRNLYRRTARWSGCHSSEMSAALAFKHWIKTGRRRCSCGDCRKSATPERRLWIRRNLWMIRGKRLGCFNLHEGYALIELASVPQWLDDDYPCKVKVGRKVFGSVKAALDAGAGTHLELTFLKFRQHDDVDAHIAGDCGEQDLHHLLLSTGWVKLPNESLEIVRKTLRREGHDEYRVKYYAERPHEAAEDAAIMGLNL